jgi:hypothetical protein
MQFVCANERNLIQIHKVIIVSRTFPVDLCHYPDAARLRSFAATLGRIGDQLGSTILATRLALAGLLAAIP